MTRRGLAPLNHSVGAVIVDAFKILCFDAIPVDVRMGIALERDGADEVFDEDGIIVSPFGDVFFIRPLEEGENFGAGTRFDERDEVFDPDGLPEGDFEADEAALVVGAPLADGFAAGAKGGDGDGDGDFKAEILAVEGGIEADLVIDEAGRGGHGSFFFNEIREVEFEVSGVGLEAFLEGTENGGNTFDVDEAAVFLENFEEAAHVGAFELVGEIDGEGDGGDGVLGGVSAIADEDGVAQAFDADLINAQVAGIGGRLGIVEGIRIARGAFQDA